MAGRSTNDAIYHALDRVYRSVDGGNCVSGLFFDLSRAFELLDHSILIEKLMAIGVRGDVLRLFQSFLLDRVAYVCVAGERDNVTQSFYSKLCMHGLGVPQGSILGPTLFLLYVNDLNQVFDDCALSQYADDTTCIVSGSTVGEVSQRASRAIDHMVGWCESNALVLNGDKTSLVHFRNGTQRHGSSLYVRMDGKSLPERSVVVFLGLTLDEHMKWNPQIDKLLSKLSSAVHGVRILRGCVDIATLRHFYFAYVESRLRYGIIFWGGASAVHDLFVLQKRILRCMVGVSSTVSCRTYFKELNILPLASLYIFELLMFYKKNEQKFLKNSQIFNVKETRNKDLLSVPRHKTKFFELSPQYRAIICFNRLPDGIRGAHSLNSYKRALKRFLIDQVFYSLDEFLNL